MRVAAASDLTRKNNRCCLTSAAADHNEKYDNLLRTPNLDQLAGTGIKLEHYYVQPICTPTRSQLMSGLYQIHTGLQHGVIHPQQPYGLSTNLSLMTNHLIERGYVCHKVGKWHLGCE